MARPRGRPPRVRGPNGRYLTDAAPQPAPEPVVAASEVVEEATEEVAEPVEAVIEKTIEVTTAPAMAEPDKREARQMVEKMTSTAQAAFTQASDKAREALDKTVKSFEEANEFAKGNVEALVAAGKAAAAGFETIAQGAADYSKKSFEQTTVAVRTLAAAKTPNDFFKAQNDFAKSQFDSLVAETSRASETMLKLFGEVFEPISNRVALAADRVRVGAQ